jgi:putative hydrolase of the HAD superfamily
VLGEAPADVAALDRADVATWSHPYEPTLRLAERLAARGTGLALLSNAPLSLAAAVDRMSWTDLVTHRFFSCRIGATKPDPAAYRAVLDRIGAAPAHVTFVDDRPANVAGAEAVGIRGVLFTGPAALAAELDLQGES